MADFEFARANKQIWIKNKTERNTAPVHSRVLDEVFNSL